MSALTRRHGRIARGLALSLQLLLAHRLRTALSLSGLLLGVATVMVMAAVGEGAQRRLLARMETLGTNLLIVSAAPQPRIAGRSRQVDMQTELRATDAALIVERSPLALAAAPTVNQPLIVRWQSLNTTTVLTGTTAEGLGLRNIHAQTGRLFDAIDDRERRRVAVVGPTVARVLFGGIDPVGQSIRIGNVPFEVLGVTRPRGIDPNGTDLDNTVLVPLQTAGRRVFNIPYVHTLLVEAADSTHLEALARDVRTILRERIDPRTGVTDPFMIQNQEVLLRTERGTAQAMDRLVAGVTALALFVGAIGILAVMLMSVRERTREIGLRRALGATRRDIQIQFLLEATALAMLGGAAGVVLGVVAASAAALLGPWDLVLSWRPALLGLTSSALLGILAGAVPATRAAHLQPREALRA